MGLWVQVVPGVGVDEVAERGVGLFAGVMALAGDGVVVGSGGSAGVEGLLPVADLADDAVIGVADDLGAGRPRPLVADGAVVVPVMGCSAR